MPISYDADEARLEGVCSAEEAEELVEWLQQPNKHLDLTGCVHLHTAVFQVVIMTGVPFTPPNDPFLRRCLDAVANPGVPDPLDE